MICEVLAECGINSCSSSTRVLAPHPAGHVLAHLHLVHNMAMSVEIHAPLRGDGEGVAASVVLFEEGERVTSGYNASTCR